MRTRLNNLMELLMKKPLHTNCKRCNVRFDDNYFIRQLRAWHFDEKGTLCDNCNTLLETIKRKRKDKKTKEANNG